MVLTIDLPTRVLETVFTPPVAVCYQTSRDYKSTYNFNALGPADRSPPRRRKIKSRYFNRLVPVITESSTRDHAHATLKSHIQEYTGYSVSQRNTTCALGSNMTR